MNQTFEEFVTHWRELEKEPKDPNLKLTCACGEHTELAPLDDAQLKDLYEILNDV